MESMLWGFERGSALILFAPGFKNGTSVASLFAMTDMLFNVTDLAGVFVEICDAVCFLVCAAIIPACVFICCAFKFIAKICAHNAIEIMNLWFILLICSPFLCVLAD